jgi:hypothetical protein
VRSIMIPVLLFFCFETAVADELAVDSFALGQSLAKAREALSEFAYNEEAFNGSIYRTTAAKISEAVMLGFDSDKVVMISKTTLLDQNSTLKPADIRQNLIAKYGATGIAFAFSEGDTKYNSLVWGKNFKEEAGNALFCVIYQVKSRKYLSTIPVSDAFYKDRDNVWKIPFAYQEECPEAHFSSGGPDNGPFHRANAGQVRVVHWITDNDKVISVQESVLDHTMNGRTAPVAAVANAFIPPSVAYSRIIGQTSNFPLF